MNYGRILLAGVVATVAYFLYGFLVEGLLIAKDSRPFSAVYRSAEDLKPHIPLGLLSTFLAILVAAFIYAKAYAGGGAIEGLRFGLGLAVFVVCTVVAHN